MTVFGNRAAPQAGIQPPLATAPLAPFAQHPDQVRPLAPSAPTPAPIVPVVLPHQPSRLRRLLRVPASNLIAVTDALVLVTFVIATPQHRYGMATFAVIAFAFLRLAGLQRSRPTLSVLDDLPALLTVLLAATGLAAGLRVVIRNDTDVQHLLKWLVFASVCVLVERGVSYAVVRHARRAGLVSHPTVIIGCGVIGAQIARALLDNPQYGLRPVGLLDDEPLLTVEERPVPLLSGTDRLAEVIAVNGIRDVIVAFSSRNELDLIDILRTCDRLGVEIFAVPRLFEIHTSGAAETVRGMPLVRMRRPTFRSWTWRLKRAMDIGLSALALVLLSPLLLVCAVAVRITDGPGVLFRQQRVGMDGTTFDVLKFRTLKPTDDLEAATTWNVAHDDRISAGGRIMRRLSLDELPQLWNVLKGDMSLVGPRPERPHFVDQFATEHREYLHRLRVPCGLTGWAQVNGLRGDTSIRERARFDNYYIENWSLWLDLKILLRTAAQVVRMAGG